MSATSATDYKARIAGALGRYYANHDVAAERYEIIQDQARQAKREAREYPLEANEQKVAVQWLRLHRIRFVVPMNGAHLAGRDSAERARKMSQLKALGLEVGVPDILIVDPPPGSRLFGCVVEMKRQREAYSGNPDRQVQPHQQLWLDAFSSLTWATIVGWGADDAIKKLGEMGY